jgi:Tfp pilus assembly protein PilN
MDELAAQQNALRPRLDRLGKFLKSRERLSALLAALGQGLPESISLDTISFEEVGSENKTSSGKVKKRLSVKGLCYLGSAEKETNVISGWAKSLSLKKPLSSNFSEIKLEEVSREKTQDQTMTRFSILGE